MLVDGAILYMDGRKEFGEIEVPDVKAESERVAYSGIELAQQDITDLQLSDIEQGQSLTDLELMILEVQNV